MQSSELPRKNRNPVHIERAQGGGARQRVWTWLRTHRDSEWTNRELALQLGVHPKTVADYTAPLALAGYVTATKSANGVIAHTSYRFAKDHGVHAPRLDKHGQPVTQGRGNQAMWGSMRRIDHDWDYRQMAALASTDDHPVAEGTAQAYVQTLAAAGYLIETAPRKLGKGARPARYQLHPRHAKKPLAPMIQRLGAVYDPNEGRVVWMEEVDPDA